MERLNCQSPNKELLIQVAGASKILKSGLKPTFALKRTDMTLRKGETLGVIGPNGAGKTTLFNVIGAFHRRNAGDVYFEGTSIDELKDEYFYDVGYCLQEDVFWDDVSVEKHLEIMCYLNGVDTKVISDWLKFLGLENFKDYQA